MSSRSALSRKYSQPISAKHTKSSARLAAALNRARATESMIPRLWKAGRRVPRSGAPANATEAMCADPGRRREPCALRNSGSGGAPTKRELPEDGDPRGVSFVGQSRAGAPDWSGYTSGPARQEPGPHCIRGQKTGGCQRAYALFRIGNAARRYWGLKCVKSDHGPALALNLWVGLAPGLITSCAPKSLCD